MRLRIIFIGHQNQDFLKEQKKYRESIVSPNTTVEIKSIEEGPETIEQDLDELLAGPAILKEVRLAETEGAHAVVVDCALDPALSALREAVSIPVVGAGQAAFALALTLGDSFSIISPLRSLAPAYRRRIREYGFTSHLASIRTIDFPILDLLNPEAGEAFVTAGKSAIEEDGADVLVLGCTGMSPVVPVLQARLPVPLVDPAAAAISFAEMAVKQGLSHSKISYPAKENSAHHV
jgi:allantoin racemase